MGDPLKELEDFLKELCKMCELDFRRQNDLFIVGEVNFARGFLIIYEHHSGALLLDTEDNSFNIDFREDMPSQRDVQDILALAGAMKYIVEWNKKVLAEKSDVS